jgi:hypothetical protein
LEIWWERRCDEDVPGMTGRSLHDGL